MRVYRLLRDGVPDVVLLGLLHLLFLFFPLLLLVVLLLVALGDPGLLGGGGLLVVPRLLLPFPLLFSLLLAFLPVLPFLASPGIFEPLASSPSVTCRPSLFGLHLGNVVGLPVLTRVWLLPVSTFLQRLRLQYSGSRVQSTPFFLKSFSR